MRKLATVAFVVTLALVPVLAHADLVPPPPPPPKVSPVIGGSGGIPWFVKGFFGVVIFFTILNPKKNSDSIFGNTIHNQWKCQKPKDWRPRCN